MAGVVGCRRRLTSNLRGSFLRLSTANPIAGREMTGHTSWPRTAHRAGRAYLTCDGQSPERPGGSWGAAGERNDHGVRRGSTPSRVVTFFTGVEATNLERAWRGTGWRDVYTWNMERNVPVSRPIHVFRPAPTDSVQAPILDSDAVGSRRG